MYVFHLEYTSTPRKHPSLHGAYTKIFKVSVFSPFSNHPCPDGHNGWLELRIQQLIKFREHSGQLQSTTPHIASAGTDENTKSAVKPADLTFTAKGYCYVVCPRCNAYKQV